MPTLDDLQIRIGDAIALAQGGEREAARAQFDAIWPEIQSEAQAVLRCMVAHHMADLQEDLRDELSWDLRALEAAALLTDDLVRQQHEALTVAQLYPSLHLNLAEDYRKLGDVPRARAHLAQASEAVEALPDKEYGSMIRRGLTRLAARLDEAEAGATSSPPTRPAAEASRPSA
jgi:hypothetical protein